MRPASTATDLDSLAGYFDAHYDTLRRFAYWLCGSWAEADDLVQEAFVKAARAGAKADREGMLTYCRRTISSVRTSNVRRLVVERRYLSRQAPPQAQQGPDIAESDAMWRQMMTLSPQQRACLVLRFYEDMTEAEIAASLGVTAGTVHKQIARGLDRLRSTMEVRHDG